MAWRLLVTGGGGLREFAWPGLERIRRIEGTGTGAMCASDGRLYLAGENGVIARMDAGTLAVTGSFAGGPGMAQLAASGNRLYALCADGDSLLMLDGATGAPVTLNRVGANPTAMHMDAAGRRIAVAGGECGMTALVCARTLDVTGTLDMPGMAQAAVWHAGGVATLCLNENMDSTLIIDGAGGSRRMMTLRGMPGALLPCEGALLAATQGWLYAVSPDGARVLRRTTAPGRARRLIFADGRLLLLDGIGEALHVLRAGRWRRVAGEARDMLLLADNMEGAGEE